jgi:hypothetical protein
MLMRAFLLGLMIVVPVTAASAQFAVDVTHADLRKQDGSLALEDLAIEETGLVTGARFCTDAGMLYVDRNSTLANEKTEYGMNYRVQRKQGNKVAVEASAGSKARSLDQALATMIGTALQIRCARFELGPEQRFEVMSINGETSASALLKR